MWIRILSFLLISLLSVGTWAAKEAIFIGGGDEPGSPNTVFDKMYSSFMTSTQSAGWNSQSVYNGEHSNSEALANKLSKGQNKPVSIENVVVALESLKSRIENSSLKTGDSLLIAIGAHGSPRSEEATHGIAANDGNLSLDNLSELKILAEQKGIKLAILDMSCYSGNTQALASDKTCVVSSSNASTVGYDVTGDSLMKYLIKGNSIEQAYAGMRDDPESLSNATPMISTEAGKKASEATSFLSQEMISGNNIGKAVCESMGQDHLTKLVENMKAISEGKLAKDLQQAIEAYQKKRSEAVNALDSLLKTETACIFVNRKNYCATYKDFDELGRILQVKEKSESLSPDEKDQIKQIQALLNSPEHKKYTEEFNKYQKQIFEIRGEASRVAEVERQIYKKIYTQESARSKAPNPCKDFVL